VGASRVIHTSSYARSNRLVVSNFRLARSIVALGATAYFVPLVAPLIFVGRLARELPSTDNSQLASLLAALAALLIFRRVTAYPGARSFSYIVPAFSTTFGIAAAILLLFREPYSGPMLLTGYAASIGVTFLGGFFEQRLAPSRLYYVPTGKMKIVGDVHNVEWIRMDRPIVPDDPGASIVADLRYDHSDDWERMLAEAAIRGIPVYHTKQLRESLTGRVQIEHLSENSFGSLIPGLAYRGVKRAIDIIASIILLPFLILPLLMVALAVRLTSPGPVLFRQRRMGYRGKPFDMLKFRTMIDRPAVPAGSARDAAITQDDDDRITSIGRFLRKSRLDEFPQIVNILRGEMSWIGPRPEAVPLSEWYEKEIPFYRYRHIVRPGITGWAQVNQGHVAALDDVGVKLHYDFYYVKFFSFWLDMLIALRTVAIMMTGFGAK
jgi:lipopolysaccharide/colanic/teichoic acid biosynthesis glycosyltransferase